MAASALLLAWAGLSSVWAAPQLFPVSNNNDVVNRVISGLNNNDMVTRVISGLNIQGAVAQALAARNQGQVTRSQDVARQVTRTQNIGTGEWSEWTTVNPSSQVSVNNVNTFPSSQLANTRTRTLSTRVQGGSRRSGNSQAIVSSVLTALNPEIERAVANALRAGSTRTVSSNVRRVSSANERSTSDLVSQIISILTPTIRSSVAQALAGRAVSQQSFTSSYQTNTQTIDRESGVMKVLDALEPMIASQVAAAIENMRQTQIARLRQQNAVSESQVESLVQQIIVTLTPNIRAAVRSALEKQAQQNIAALASQTTNIDQASLVKQIIQILRPQVQKAFSEAVAAWEAEQRQREAAFREQQRQAALREPQRQAALLEQQRQAALLEQQRQAALLAAQQQQTASGDLNSLFGSGHEVLSVVPGQAKVEYQIGIKQPAAATRPFRG